MYLDLSGIWKVQLQTASGMQEKEVCLPGILQAQGCGNEIAKETKWVSSLHDPYWWEREEYQYAQENGIKVPFLSQPPRHFLGKALYQRKFEIEEETDDTWYLYIEMTHWRSKAFIDGQEMGQDCSLCTAHRIACKRLGRGMHLLEVEIDNAMQYPYRPDGHGVSDALGATWNGMAGEIALLTRTEWEKREERKKAYADEHPRHIEVKNGKFYVDGKPEYFRGTHFGGDYPLTGFPTTDRVWWEEKLGTIKSWGLNFVRCHSYCPPEMAFQVADELGMYLQPECGMWNCFAEEIPMLEVLRTETRRILEQFGHHPSFVLFSPTNEPSGNWYRVLRKWVNETREYDKLLGYKNRRLYTAQSGWFYDVPPAEIEGTDYLYFHRSAYGPLRGGTIRNSEGWKGKNYTPSIAGTRLPVICHELGQWCAYPDFRVMEKFTGYLQPGNFEVFRENCREKGLLSYNEIFAFCSGRNQLRMYKEDIEANLRTPNLYGFELLDLHDYLGQGTALVGLLDAFWQEKGYAKPEEFRNFCDETVLLAAFNGYVYTNQQKVAVPVSICHFGKADLRQVTVKWSLRQEETIWKSGEIFCQQVVNGDNTDLGNVVLDFREMHGNHRMIFTMEIDEVTRNTWELYVFEKKTLLHGDVVSTQNWNVAKTALQQGKRVIYMPYLSELDYECPPASMKNVFWNAQMGPTWGRSLGLVVQEESPLFQDFPTEKDGGWQWEDILTKARGFCMYGLEQIRPLVRVIDDWNRNLPLGLIWEAKAEKGSLLVISADLHGSFEDRPAANALWTAICRYVDSQAFAPKQYIETEAVERHLFPMNRMEELTETIEYEKTAVVENPEALVTANPTKSVCIEKEEFPITITVRLKKTIMADGILYVPEQRGRYRNSYPKDYDLQIRNMETGSWENVEMDGNKRFRNTSLSQKVSWKHRYMTDSIRLVVKSCYGSRERKEWEERQDGYYEVCKCHKVRVEFGGLHVLCDGKAVSADSYFLNDSQSSTTKEIDD